MKKQAESRTAYTPPQMEILDIAIEQGFAQSTQENSIDEMEEIDNW